MESHTSLLLTFLAVSFVTVATPGPSTLFIIRQAGAAGLRAGLAAVAGILMADALFLLAGALGVGAALAAAPSTVEIIKLLGAAYFAYLSYRMAWPHLRGSAHGSHANQTGGESTAGPVPLATVVDGLRQAFVMHIVNTKALLFFGLLVPQFLRADEALAPQLATLMGLHLTLAASVLAAYAAFGAALLATATGKKLTKPLDLVGAVVMLGLSGGILATAYGG